MEACGLGVCRGCAECFDLLLFRCSDIQVLREGLDNDLVF